MKEINPLPPRDPERRDLTTIVYYADSMRYEILMPRVGGPQIGPRSLLNELGNSADPISPDLEKRCDDRRWRDQDQAVRHFSHVARVFAE